MTTWQNTTNSMWKLFLPPWLRGKSGEVLRKDWHSLPPPWSCIFEFITNYQHLCDQLNWVPGPSSHTSSDVILSHGREEMNIFTQQIGWPSTKSIECGVQASPSFVDYEAVAWKQKRPEPIPAGHWASTYTLHALSQPQKRPFSPCCTLQQMLLWMEPEWRFALKPTTGDTSKL